MELQLPAGNPEHPKPLRLLAIVFLTAIALNWCFSGICPAHTPECLLGYDIDTYVSFTVNGSYEGWGGRNTLYASNELPVALSLLRLNPFRLMGEWFAYRVFMLFFMLLSGVLVVGFLRKRFSSVVLPGVVIWLFNPLNYRLFLDLTQNLVGNVVGLSGLVFVVFDRPKTGFLVLLLGFFVHQSMFFWVVVGIVFWLEKEYLVVFLAWVLLLGGFMLDGGWRLWFMLPFCMVVLACALPVKYCRAVSVVTFITFFLSPVLFMGSA